MDWFRRRRNVPPSKSRLPTRAIVSYIIDYLIIIILAIIYGLLDKLVTPFAQHFSLHDISIQYPYAVHERVPIAWALVISALFPAVVIAVYTLLVDGWFSHRDRPRRHSRSRYTWADRLWELNCGWLGLLLAQGAAFVITGTLKNLCGRPRPDLVDRCQPRAGSADGVPYGLVTKAICTQADASMMQDGFRSFPSGHSSSSFSGLFYLSLYLSAKLHVLDQKGEVWRTVVVLIPTVAAACIAMSRIMDARHHAFDVLFGSALGLLCAWASYRQYFPPVGHVWDKGRAYPMRIWGTPVKRPVLGKVLVDGATLEVLDDRVPASADSNDDYGDGARESQYELRRGTDANASVGRDTDNRHYSVHASVDTDMDMDLETGYARVGRDAAARKGPGYPAPTQSQSTANAFHDQTEQIRRPRSGYAETDNSPRGRGGIRDLEHPGSEEDDDLVLQRAPLQPGEVGA